MERKRSDAKRKRAPSGAAVPRVDLTQALYRALFLEWAEKGFAAVSLERVVKRHQELTPRRHEELPPSLLG